MQKIKKSGKTREANQIPNTQNNVEMVRRRMAIKIKKLGVRRATNA